MATLVGRDVWVITHERVYQARVIDQNLAARTATVLDSRHNRSTVASEHIAVTFEDALVFVRANLAYWQRKLAELEAVTE